MALIFNYLLVGDEYCDISAIARVCSEVLRTRFFVVFKTGCVTEVRTSCFTVKIYTVQTPA
jgi:hypothetical protein